MPDDANLESRLRELLRDPRWSLRPRPDAQVRIRRAARRQRAKTASLAGAAAGTMIAACAAIIPATIGLSGHTRGPAAATPASRGRAARPSTSPTQTQSRTGSARSPRSAPPPTRPVNRSDVGAEAWRARDHPGREDRLHHRAYDAITPVITATSTPGPLIPFPYHGLRRWRSPRMARPPMCSALGR